MIKLICWSCVSSWANLADLRKHSPGKTQTFKAHSDKQTCEFVRHPLPQRGTLRIQKRFWIRRRSWKVLCAEVRFQKHAEFVRHPLPQRGILRIQKHFWIRKRPLSIRSEVSCCYEKVHTNSKGGKKPVAPTLPVLLHCVLQLQKNNSTSPCNLQIPTFSYVACSFAYPQQFGFLASYVWSFGPSAIQDRLGPAIYSKYILPIFCAVGFASSISWQHLCTALPIFVPMCIDRIPFWRPWTYLDSWNPAFSRVQSGGKNGTAESSSGLLLDLSDCGRAKEHLEEAQVPVRYTWCWLARNLQIIGFCSFPHIRTLCCFSKRKNSSPIQRHQKISQMRCRVLEMLLHQRFRSGLLGSARRMAHQDAHHRLQREMSWKVARRGGVPEGMEMEMPVLGKNSKTL